MPRWIVLASAALAAVALIWGLTRLLSGGSPEHDAVASGSPSMAATTSASASPAPIRSPNAELLAYIYERAHDPTPAEDLVREDTSTTSCTLVPRGVAPEDRVRHYVLAQFPRTRILDVARILDKFTGLCVLELRAEQDTGTVLVVRIVAPIEDAPIVEPRVDRGSSSTEGGYTRYVRVTRREGWLVTAGASGPADSGPSLTALLTVAREQSLLW